MAAAAWNEPPPAGPGQAYPAELGLLEAVRLTLSQDRTIQIQGQQVEFAAGAVQEARGQFDLALETEAARSLFRTPLTDTNRLRIDRFNRGFLDSRKTFVTEEIDYRLAFKKQFRWGPTISPGVDLVRVSDNFDQQRAVNRVNLNFRINIPLLKGFGRATTGAAEQAARYQQVAAGLDLRHVIALRIVNTVSAYWNCLMAQRQLQILTETKQRAADLIGGVQELVEGGELPAADLKQVHADLAEKTAAEIAGQQRFMEAQQALGLAIGLPAAALAFAPLPADAFPLPQTNYPSWNAAGARLVSESLERRPDYQATLKEQEAAQVLSTAARKNLKPRLDLDLQVGYAGLRDGSHFRDTYGALDPDDLTGLNTLGLLRLEWPLGNNAARGQFAQQEAAHQQSLLRTEELARQINSRIWIALSEVERTAEELRKAREASAFYQQAVVNEREKLRIGTSTIINLIITADRLSQAQLGEVSSQARFAIALVRLRFETGLLLPADEGDRASIRQEDLVTLPDWTATDPASGPLPSPR